MAVATRTTVLLAAVCILLGQLCRADEGEVVKKKKPRCPKWVLKFQTNMYNCFGRYFYDTRPDCERYQAILQCVQRIVARCKDAIWMPTKKVEIEEALEEVMYELRKCPSTTSTTTTTTTTTNDNN